MVAQCKAANARPMLILECDRVISHDGHTGGLNNKLIDCVLLKLSLEGVSVLRTRDVAHTRDVIVWLVKRCREGKIPTFEATLNVAQEAGTQRFKKKDFSGPPFALMLTAIRGVSKSKASEITRAYKSAKTLIQHLEATGGKLGIKGIGKVIEKSIFTALIGEESKK
jgi:ERCC4-type nuclease